MSETASARLAVPVLKNTSGSEYLEWKKLAQMWRRLTKVKKEEQASYVVLSGLANQEAKTIGLGLSDTELNADDGLDILIAELDKAFQKDDDARGYEAWLLLKNFVKKPDASYQEYCSQFNRLRKEAADFDVQVSDTTFAFMLLDGAHLPKNERLIILSVAMSSAVSSGGKLEPSKIEHALKRLTESKTTPSDNNNEFDALKINDTVTSQNQYFENQFPPNSEALIMQSNRGGYQRGQWPRSRSTRGYNRGNRGDFRGNFRGTENRNFNNNNNFNSNNASPPVGRSCYRCQSPAHFLRDCPHPPAGESSLVTNGERGPFEEDIFLTYGEGNSVFATSSLPDFCNETKHAIIDCACTKTVCSNKWLDDFLLSQNVQYNSNVVYESTDSKYTFGDSRRSVAKFAAVLPVCMGGVKFKIRVDVIDGSLPLLLSRPTLQRLKAVLNFDDDSLSFCGGPKIHLNRNRAGHYVIPIVEDCSNSFVEELNDVLALQVVDRRWLKNYTRYTATQFPIGSNRSLHIQRHPTHSKEMPSS